MDDGWQSLIGAPYEMHGNPPVTFDCWQLVLYVRKQFLGEDTDGGFDMPKDYEAIDVPKCVARIGNGWQVTDSPKPGDVAFVGRDDYSHTAIVVPGGMLHAIPVRHAGQVCFHKMNVMRRLFQFCEVYTCLK